MSLTLATTATSIGLGTTDSPTFAGLTLTDNLTWKSGTAISGILDHANTSSTKTYTFPDASGNVALMGFANTGSLSASTTIHAGDDIDTDDNVKFKSGTANFVILDHAASAERTVTFQDATGTVALTSQIPGSFGFVIDGGGSVITTGIKGDIIAPYSMTATKWKLVADQSGSIVIDVWKDSYCVDEETQALTKQGWKNGNLITQDDEILAFNSETGLTQWEKPLGIFKDKYSGPMLQIGSKSGRISALVTPNHEWPAIRLYGRKELRLPIERISTIDLPDKCLLLRSADYSEVQGKHSDDFVKLIAWIFTEGSSRNDHKNISITQSEKTNPSFCNEIEEIIVKIGAINSNGYGNKNRPKRVGSRGSIRRKGFWFSKLFRKESDCWNWALSGEYTDQIMSVFSDKKNKILSYDFINSLSSNQAKLFVETAMKGDGIKKTFVFTQHNRDRMDNFSAISVLAGYSPSLGKNYTSCSMRKNRKYTWFKDTPKEWIHYEGNIWCPTLPSGYWVARKDGKVSITGNSNFPPTVADTVTGSEKPTLISQSSNQDTSLTTTISVTAGDVLRFNVDSASTVTRVTLLYEGTRS